MSFAAAEAVPRKLEAKTTASTPKAFFPFMSYFSSWRAAGCAIQQFQQVVLWRKGCPLNSAKIPLFANQFRSCRRFCPQIHIQSGMPFFEIARLPDDTAIPHRYPNALGDVVRCQPDRAGGRAMPPDAAPLSTAVSDAAVGSRKAAAAPFWPWCTWSRSITVRIVDEH
jgi:hypothetical protein